MVANAGANPTSGVKEYQQACNGGEMGGCNSLRFSYAKGQGVPQNYDKANAFYQQACDGGEMIGCHNLGVSYRDGEGVPQDDRKANELFQQACDGGVMNSCNAVKEVKKWWQKILE